MEQIFIAWSIQLEKKIDYEKKLIEILHPFIHSKEKFCTRKTIFHDMIRNG